MGRVQYWLLGLLKLAVTLAFFSFLLSQVDIQDAIAHIQAANVWSLVFALAVSAGQLFLLALRWKVILSNLGVYPAYAKLAAASWEGSFYNLILPTGVGGDAVRMYRCYRSGAPLRTAVGSVLVDRYVGVAMLLLFAAVILLRPEASSFLPVGWPRTFAVGLIILALSPMMIDKVPGFWWRWRSTEPLAWFAATARSVMTGSRSSLLVIAISAAIHGCTVLSFGLVGHAISLGVSFDLYFAVIPLAMLATMIPISIGGWGIREGAVVGLFVLAGVPASGALTLSVLFGLVLLALGLIGGAIGLLQPERPGSLDTKQEAD